MIVVEYKIERKIKTNCCVQVYNVWNTETVNCNTEQEATDYINNKYSPLAVRIK